MRQVGHLGGQTSSRVCLHQCHRLSSGSAAGDWQHRGACLCTACPCVPPLQSAPLLPARLPTVPGQPGGTTQHSQGQPTILAEQAHLHFLHRLPLPLHLTLDSALHTGGRGSTACSRSLQ